MNDETTRLINEEQAPIEQTKKVNYTSEDSTQAKQKKGKAGKTVAAAAGGFVAGATVGAGATASASTSTEEMPTEEKLNQTEEVIANTDLSETETPETPAPEQAILANDEGIRYAHVNADNFNDAFAQAREQVGPGGVFEYNGRIYATYYAEEWNDMSSQERADFQSKVYEVAPTHHAEPSHSSMAHNSSVESTHHEPEIVAENVQNTTTESIPANTEMIAAEPVDNEIRVLGVEAVQNGYGEIMNVALVECEGDQALLIDVDNNGSIDVLIHDDNFDGDIQENEIHDISGSGLEVADL
ncbi:MAG: hypothetical protein K2K25_02220, partial [Muribaculaceae bacterium]|nr:hypothetical protein [Muribaculaceae bacterium]